MSGSPGWYQGGLGPQSEGRESLSNGYSNRAELRGSERHFLMEATS